MDIRGSVLVVAFALTVFVSFSDTRLVSALHGMCIF